MPTLSTIIKKEISIFQIGKLWPSRLRIIMDSLQDTDKQVKRENNA